jgi:hypothetical protein
MVGGNAHLYSLRVLGRPQQPAPGRFDMQHNRVDRGQGGIVDDPIERSLGDFMGRDIYGVMAIDACRNGNREEDCCDPAKQRNGRQDLCGWQKVGIQRCNFPFYKTLACGQRVRWNGFSNPLSAVLLFYEAQRSFSPTDRSSDGIQQAASISSFVWIVFKYRMDIIAGKQFLPDRKNLPSKPVENVRKAFVPAAAHSMATPWTFQKNERPVLAIRSVTNP